MSFSLSKPFLEAERSLEAARNNAGTVSKEDMTNWGDLLLKEELMVDFIVSEVAGINDPNTGDPLDKVLAYGIREAIYTDMDFTGRLNTFSSNLSETYKVSDLSIDELDMLDGYQVDYVTTEEFMVSMYKPGIIMEE